MMKVTHRRSWLFLTLNTRKSLSNNISIGLVLCILKTQQVQYKILYKNFHNSKMSICFMNFYCCYVQETGHGVGAIL